MLGRDSLDGRGFPVELLLVKRFVLTSFVLFLFCFPAPAKEKPAVQASTQSEILQLLGNGDQSSAEDRLVEILKKNPRDADAAFLWAVCSRSRFAVKRASAGFLMTMKLSPDSPEARASACVLGIDLAQDQNTSLYYYNALLLLINQNPDSIPLHWLGGVMARSLTRDGDFSNASERKRRIVMCGLREYDAMFALMAPGTGPILVHQSLANLLDEEEGSDLAWKHREIVLKTSRETWALQGAANTLLALNREPEAYALMQEVLAKAEEPKAIYLHSFALAAQRTERPKEAVEAWEKAAALTPDYPEYLVRAMTGYRDMGDYTAALRCARELLAREPENQSFQIWEARFSAVLGEAGAGEKVIKAGAFDFRGKVQKGSKDSDPWFAAVEMGDFNQVRALMSVPGFDVDRSNPKSLKQTALMVAACNGWEPIVKDLIQKGAKLDQKDNNGSTALHYSAQFVQPRMMQLLLDAGANPDIQDKWGQTPIINCAGERNREGMKMLLARKADMGLMTNHGGGPLHYAAGFGHLELLNWLIAAGADVNGTIPNSGDTPLLAASKDFYWHPTVVAPLIEAGADVNAKDKEGRTALYRAINPLLNIPLVQLLLEKGAKPDLANNEGITPIAEARLLGFEDLARQMEKKTGTAQPFVFPKFELPEGSLTVEERNSCSYVLPLLLAQGHPLGRPSGVKLDEKKAARQELEWMFEISNAEELKVELRELEAFEPRYRDSEGLIPSDVVLVELGGKLKEVAHQIHVAASKGEVDESAWIKAHIIYLADLGLVSEFLKPEEADTLIKKASVAIRSNYKSWPEFTRSFVIGARFNNAWEADRYQEVCNRIVEAKLVWP